MVLLESLRLYSPVVFIRRAAGSDIQLGSIRVPEGTLLSIPIALLHRDNDVWGHDADEFNPARFEHGISKAAANHPNALLGAGTRLRPWLWAEAWGSAGAVPVLAEADGTYVYNLLDPLGRRAAASLLILGPQRLRLRLVYGAEQRRITLINSTYTLHTLSAALAWIW